MKRKLSIPWAPYGVYSLVIKFNIVPVTATSTELCDEDAISVPLLVNFTRTSECG